MKMFFTSSAFAIIVGIIAFLFLECINYIEHYGLRRFKNGSGRYERVQTYHSWNSNRRRRKIRHGRPKGLPHAVRRRPQIPKKPRATPQP